MITDNTARWIENLAPRLRDYLRFTDRTQEASEADDLSAKAKYYFGTGLLEDFFGSDYYNADFDPQPEEGVKVTAVRDLSALVEGVEDREKLEESISSAYASLSAAGISPCIHICEEKVIRQLDKGLLSRILGNILSNAAKYSDGDLDIALAENGEMRFRNSASRLDKLQTEKLFDRFYTVEAARRSTGLGLSIARDLTERMGGKISARYENGSLTVILNFP